MDREKLQYFSKYHKKWVDVKYSDRVETLKKFKYKIRVNPKYKK